ncbi:phage virion morphogenesis protein [Parafrankia discariae]|uniref:HK97 gp10 family phage protein n=1 Tax=Parafrankia discariae TaxID=365528 RepID=UPI0003664B03|nr:HK97 gp10 family phage protein [Parafrankia discariae]
MPRVTLSPSAGAWLTDQLDDWMGRELGPAILDDARRMVPVLTGALRTSLRIETYRAVLRIGSDLPYAAVVELGISRMVGHSGRVWFMHRAPQPFLRPALYRPRSG